MRARCEKCHFHHSKCLCDVIVKINHQTPVIVIRYPKEAKHPFNTINIAKLNLNLNIFDTEEVDSENELVDYLKKFKNPALLFPIGECKDLSSTQNNEIDALIILDGTWDKAKKIYFKSKFLQGLTKVKLNLDQISQYQIRKSNFPGGVSSIEAICYSLHLLEDNFPIEVALQPFLFFVTKQIELAKKKE